MLRAVGGDRDAVARVLADVRPLVVRYCLGRLGPVAGEDVAQEVCLTLLKVLPRYRDEGRPFAAYVYGIAARKVAEAVRSARRYDHASLDTLADRPDPADGPEPLAIAAEESARLHVLLDQLTATQREVVVLRVAVGLTADEVAAILGTSAAAVRVAQHRALKTLRALADVLLEVSR